jgi:hypothetical protein
MEPIDAVGSIPLAQAVEERARDARLAAGSGDAAERLSAAKDVKALELYSVFEGHRASPVRVWKQERRRNARLPLFSLESEVSTPFGHSSP